MPEVVFSGLSDGTGLQGALFHGKKFWLSQKVPLRSRYIAEIKVRQRANVVINYLPMLTIE